ncbi:MAG: hypothetical protein JW737_02070 [Acidobacteria bacterium]|nr:hypothetical protein [Acidobacteriota bacterium]
MSELFFWIYLVNATLLIVHEIDSAYWQEWKLFKLPGGHGGFLLIHIPIVFLFLYGAIEAYRLSLFGKILSLILAAAGIFAFSIHIFFIKKGHPEFKSIVSILILGLILLISVFQMIISIQSVL